MKKLSFKPIAMAICICIFSVSCGNHETKNAGESVESSVGKTSIEAEESERIFNAYLNIKNALVLSDSDSAKTSAVYLNASLTNHSDSLALRIKNAAEKIATTTSADEQRKHFKQLSVEIYSLAKLTNTGKSIVYRQYCPMAFENEGAYWLSIESSINNPYFGESMLHCGKNVEEIKSPQ